MYDMHDDIDAFIEQNTNGILEGTRGVENLKTLLIQIGYDGVGDFLADNQMAIEEVLSWIGNQDQITEWREALLDSITLDDGAEEIEILETFIEQNTDGTLNGTRGVENLETLLSQIGYAGVGDFLSDNSGAIEAVLSWIGYQDHITEWREALSVSIAPEDDGGNPVTEAARKLDYSRKDTSTNRVIKRFVENETDVTHRGSGTDSSRFLMLIDNLGYENLTEFFTDNSGAMYTVVQWIAKQFKYEANLHLKGAEGVRRLGILVGALDYADMVEFLEDNQGAVDAIINWMSRVGTDEWKEALEVYYDE